MHVIERTLRHLAIGMLIGGLSAFLLARCSEAATLRAPMCTGSRLVVRNGTDLVVQCQPKPGSPYVDRIIVRNACPKPPRTEARTTDGGLLVDCHR